MMRPLTIILAACVLALSAFAGEPTATEKQLIALTQEWADAEVKRDVPALQRIMDDRFVATFGAGPLIDRAGYLQGLLEDPDTMLSQTLTDETVLVEGDAAVLVGTVAIRTTSHGTAMTTRYRYTTTYIRRGDRWAALTLHMVRKSPGK